MLQNCSHCRGLAQSSKLGIMMRKWRKNGTKLVTQQHGGGYGLDRNMTLEEYEKEIQTISVFKERENLHLIQFI